MKETVNKKKILETITPVIENIADRLGLVILEVSFVKESGRWFVRIFIYSQEHSISHQDCENLTRELDEYLDRLIPVPYYLEISSPGLDRKLKSPKEYNIFRGKKVEIKLEQPLEGMNNKIFQGYILGYSPDKGLTIHITDLDRKEDISEDNIASIRLKADFNKLKGDKND